MSTAQKMNLNEEILDQDKWRRINCTFKKIMSQVPKNEGTVIKVDFNARTYEVINTDNLVIADFKAPKKRRYNRMK
jgi:hypothetical protein